MNRLRLLILSAFCLLWSICDVAAQVGPTINPAYRNLPVPSAEGLPTTRLPAIELPAPPAALSPAPAELPPEVVLPLATPAEVIEPATYYWYQPRYWLQPPGWDTGVELGLNGTSGTSESVSVRAGGYTKLKNEFRKLNVDLYTNRTQANGVATQNNAQFNARHDWLLEGSPWSIYSLSQLYYDEFQAFDLNANVNSGFGYALIDTKPLKLASTIGVGASRKFGGLPDEWVPEAQFGMEYEHKIVDNHRFYTKIDYFPEFADFSTYRILTDVGWEIELVQPSNLSLKLSATDRYDGDPQGVNPHNLNYSALLLWKL